MSEQKDEAHDERIQRAVEKFLDRQAHDNSLSHRERAKRRTLARRQGRKTKAARHA